MTSCKVGSLFMYTTSQLQYTQARKVKKRALAQLVLTGGGHARLFTAASSARPGQQPPSTVHTVERSQD